MLYCLFQDSPVIDNIEQKEIDTNQGTTAHHGREPGLLLHHNGEPILLSAWAMEIFQSMLEICKLLDYSSENNLYRSALNIFIGYVEDPDQTPSARILAEMIQNEEAFFPFSMRHSKQNAEYFKSLTVNEEKKQHFEKVARQSIEDQKRLEETDNLTFPDFLNEYFAETLE